MVDEFYGECRNFKKHLPTQTQQHPTAPTHQGPAFLQLDAAYLDSKAFPVTPRTLRHKAVGRCVPMFQELQRKITNSWGRSGIMVKQTYGKTCFVNIMSQAIQINQQKTQKCSGFPQRVQEPKFIDKAMDQSKMDKAELKPQIFTTSAGEMALSTSKASVLVGTRWTPYQL